MPGRSGNFQPACGHEGGAGLPAHATGIAAHVVIYLSPGVDIWEAYEKIFRIQQPQGGGNPKIPKLSVEKIHVSLGEIDLMADLHAPWGGGGGMPDGYETARIGDWVNEIRTLRSGTTPYVQRTSTAVCMAVDN